jgi:cholesterol oxidase
MNVIVIGSGFGGAIAAKRYTEAGHRVAILELGEDWRAPGKAQQSQDPKFLFRLLRNYPIDPLVSKPKLIVTLGMGYGGGSLVYSGIHLRAPRQAFDGWPDGWTRSHLDPYYARVEQRLAIAPLADALAFGRTRAFADGARAAGLPPPQPNPLAVSGCTRCGWCVPICAFGKKVTMQHAYLADAERTGRLVVMTNRKAAYLVRAGDRYRVWFWRTDGVAQDYHRVATGPLDHLDGDAVIVAAGAIESPVLLERSLAADAGAGTQRLRAGAWSRRLGKGLDGTGDFVQGGFVPQRIEAFKGSVMMTHIDLGDYVLEDIHGIPVGAAVTMGARPATVAKPWGRAFQARYHDAEQHLLGIAIVGKQAAGTERSFSVRDDAGNALVAGKPYGPAPGALEAARAIIAGLGGQPVSTPWEQSGTAFTVHPTGGCAMGEVVRPHDLQLLDHPGLHVIDGSVLPGNPMRNPSHTIAAVAERALDVILGVRAAGDWPS